MRNFLLLDSTGPGGMMQEFVGMSVKEQVEQDAKIFRAKNLKGESPGGKGVCVYTCG